MTPSCPLTPHTLETMHTIYLFPSIRCIHAFYAAVDSQLDFPIVYYPKYNIYFFVIVGLASMPPFLRPRDRLVYTYSEAIDN